MRIEERSSVPFLGLIASCTLLGAACERSEPPPPAPGVPQELAERRSRTLSDVRYDLTLSIPESASERIRGRAVIRFRLTPNREPVALDFAADPGSVLSVRANGEPVAFRAVDQHIILPRDAVRRGAQSLEIEFRASDLSLNRNEDYLYTLFVPDRARFAFPSFDQPDIKARYRLTLNVPADWRAVANAPVADSSVSDEGRTITYRFEETPPLPTYLFAFAAGRWQLEEAVIDGRRFRMYHRETDSAKVARNRDPVFELHAAALRWMEEYTGVAYPFAKFDFVAVPAFQYGGMEHPGAVLYRDTGILLDESATQGERLRQAAVIAHETAHMWFGDLVTMRWFDDVWMKEVFANFFAAKIVNPSFPELDHELRFLLTHYPGAYEIDRTAGTHPIRQPLDNLNEAGTLYGAIIYQKAPIVMRQLEALIGESAMREGMREYVERYAFANASWLDLIDILDRRTPADLRAWSRIWVEQAGRPHIRTRMMLDGRGRIAALRLEQTDPAARDRIWVQRLNVRLAYPDTTRTFPVELDGPSVEITEAAGLPRPLYVLPNGDGLGYGLFELDDRSLAYLIDHLPELRELYLRGIVWLSLRDALLEGWLDPEVLIGLALRTLPAETDPLNTERMLDDLIETYWRYLPAGERERLAGRLEERLWAGLERADDTSVKAAYFNAYRSIALTPSATARLQRVWSGEMEIEGLPLSEQDRTRLALGLAVRAVPGADRILERQAEQIDNPDRRRRFEFLRPTVDSNAAVRDSFFASLGDPKNREQEPWVLDALALLHHPLRTGRSIEYLRPSLELLEEIQRTGDIFFPKGWLDGTFSGHGSPRAAEIICEFLDARPGYPARLRRKILQSADPVLRAAAIVHGRELAACSEAGDRNPTLTRR